MKQVYIATYKSGLKGPTKVFGSSVEDARKAAFAAYTFTSAMWNPNLPVDEVVDRVELDPDQTMDGVGCQPCVQDENYVPLTAKSILSRMFEKNDKENG